MRFTTKILILTVFIMFSSGCAYSFGGCERYVGTNEYNNCLAFNCNQQALYELGIEAYEAGNTDTAIKWLKRAAQPVSGKKTFNRPAMPGETYGTHFVYDTLPLSSGHNAAQKLLFKIYDEGIGTEIDANKARKYKRMSQKVYEIQ